MKRKLFTFEDLYNFFAKQDKDVSFNAQESDSVIVVQVPALFSSSGESSQGLMPVHLQVCHTGLNRNSSYISESNMKKYMNTLKNKPILGYIWVNEDGEADFAAHEIQKNEDDSFTYIEKPIGILPESCNPYLRYDEEKEKTYVEADGYVYEDYGNQAAGIIKEAGSKKVSCELVVENLSYNAKEKYLEITDFYFNGVTVLGSDPNTGKSVSEGMYGSNISMQDFSCKKSELNDTNSKLIDAIEKLNETLSAFNIHDFSKEGGTHGMDELLKKYGKTVEDITFDTEGLSEEELAAKFEEVFGEHEPESQSSNPEKNVFSVTLKDKTYNFELSLDEVIYALSTVVNDTYSETDNAYYSVKVYEKDVVMIDYWSGRAYRQGYKCRNGAYSLTGDRIEVYARYLSKDEENALDEMKSKYSAMENKLNEYAAAEVRAEKENLLNSVEYDVIREEENFKAFAAESDKYSVQDIKVKCDSMLLDYFKAQATAYAAGTTLRKTVKLGSIKNTEDSPYGSLFAKKAE